MLTFLRAIAISLILIWNTSARAADIRVVPPPAGFVPSQGFETRGISGQTSNGELWIMLKGEIRRGDAAKLERFIDRSQYGQPTKAIRIALDSSGGDYAEALKIANQPAQTMVVGDGAKCHAACALIFISGRQIDGDGYFPPDRYAHKNADINFFAPEFNFPENATSQQLKAAYERATRLSRTLLTKRRLWWIPNEFFLALVDPNRDWRTFVKEANITVFGKE